MTTSTEVVWALGTPIQSEGEEVQTQAAAMAMQGKTDDIPIIEQNVPLENQRTVTRTWTTTADAEEWVAFVLTYNPVSAAIVP